MSENPVNVNTLSEIYIHATEQDKKIWASNARSNWYQKNTEELKTKTNALKEQMEQLEKKVAYMDCANQQLVKEIEIQKKALRAAGESVRLQHLYNNSLIKEDTEWNKKYADKIEHYENEFEEYRQISIDNSMGYKELHDAEVIVKKLKIEKMLLEAETLEVEKTRKQFDKIHEMILQKSIIKFAEWFKVDQMEKELEQLTAAESKLLTEHFQLTEKLKQKQKHEETIWNTRKEKQKSSTQDFDEFLIKYLEEDSLSQMEVHPVVKKDSPKVKILDVKALNPILSKQPSLSSELKTIDFKRKAEHIFADIKMKRTLRKVTSSNIELSGSVSNSQILSGILPNSQNAVINSQPQVLLPQPTSSKNQNVPLKSILKHPASIVKSQNDNLPINEHIFTRKVNFNSGFGVFNKNGDPTKLETVDILQQAGFSGGFSTNTNIEQPIPISNPTLTFPSEIMNMSNCEYLTEGRSILFSIVFKELIVDNNMDTFEPAFSNTGDFNETQNSAMEQQCPGAFNLFGSQDKPTKFFF